MRRYRYRIDLGNMKFPGDFISLRDEEWELLPFLGDRRARRDLSIDEIESGHYVYNPTFKAILHKIEVEDDYSSVAIISSDYRKRYIDKGYEENIELYRLIDRSNIFFRKKPVYLIIDCMLMERLGGNLNWLYERISRKI